MVGHEDHGVPKKALAAADEALFIPMYGKGASLNVHVALAHRPRFECFTGPARSRECRHRMVELPRRVR